MAELQGKLLARASGWLKPGGTLIYAVCSLEPGEGEDIVAQAENAAQVLGITLDPIRSEDLTMFDSSLGIAPDEHGCIRILPRIGVDGFFVARFRKVI